MDPDVALQRFIAAACMGNTDEMSHYFHALKSWIERGGFPPDPIECLPKKEK